MQWIASLDFERIANAIIILLTGFIAAFGLRAGKAPTEAQKDVRSGATMEVAAALVDGTSVKLLAGSIEGHSLAIAGAKLEAVKVRECVGEVVEALKEHARAMKSIEEELREVRNELRFGVRRAERDG